MSNQSFSFDNKNTTSKEIIRRNIRHATSSKSNLGFPNIDLNADIMESSKDLVKEFVVNFRSSGGKFIPCTQENFTERLTKLIIGQQYNQILNTSSDLAKCLSENNIRFFDAIDVASPADAAIIYADVLIAGSGSVVFAQDFSLYPSVKNLASDLIIISFARNIVSDMKYAFELQMKRNAGKLPAISEIITPVIPHIIDGKENYTPLVPRFILLLIS